MYIDDSEKKYFYSTETYLNSKIYFHIKGMGDEEGDEPITNREYPGGRVGLGARVIKVNLMLMLMLQTNVTHDMIVKMELKN